MEFGEYPGVGVPDFPTGIAVDASDNVYFTKKATDEIQKFDADGNLLAEFGGSGNTNGKLNDPAALAIGPDGNLYVADTVNQRIQKLDEDGNYLAQWGAPVRGMGSWPIRRVSPSTSPPGMSTSRTQGTTGSRSSLRPACSSASGDCLEWRMATSNPPKG